MTTAASRFGSMDRLKGISAVLVVLIHTTPFYHSSVEALRWLGWAILQACQIAVPYFLVASGWAMGSRWRRGTRGFRELAKGIPRLLGLYLPWFACYLAIDAWLGYPTGLVGVLRRLLAFSDGRLAVSGYHLWFLPSLILAQLLVAASFRWTHSVVPALAAGLTLYATLYALECLGLPLPFGLVPTEGLDVSLLCVAAGAWAGASGRDRLVHGAPFVVAAIAFLPLESLLLDLVQGSRLQIHTFTVGRIALAVVALRACIAHPNLFGSGAAGRFLDALGRRSVAIYVAHLLVLRALPLDLLSSRFVRDNLVGWPLAVLGSMLLGVALERAPWTWVRRLAS